MGASMKFSKEFLASYRVVRALGQGGMGLVVEAEHLRLHRRTAIKFLRPECFDPSTRERFVREARILAKLSHPNIVQVYDANLDGEQPFLAMEFVDGPTLEAFVHQHGVLKPLDAVRLARPLLDGLGYLHDAGVLHRDLKMANVLVAGGKVPKLADFGLAWLEGGSRLTATGLAVGTPMYMAPEQLNGLPVGPEADLYAVGMMLCRMLTGTHPLHAGSAGELLAIKSTMKIEWLAARLPGVPAALTAVIARCLAPDPAARPGSAGELSELLLEAAHGGSGRRTRAGPVVGDQPAPAEAALEARPAASVPAAPRLPWLLGCAAALAVAGWLALRSWGPDSTAFRPGSVEVRALPGAARVTWKTAAPCPSRLSAGARIHGSEEATRDHAVEVAPVAWAAPGEARILHPDGTPLTSVALKAEPVPLTPAVERHGPEVRLRLALPEPMPLTLTFTRPGASGERVVRLPERKNFREAVPLEGEPGDQAVTLSLPPGRVVRERFGPFPLPAPERLLVGLVKDLDTLPFNSVVRQAALDATLNQGSPRLTEKRFEALLGSIRWRERFDEAARAAGWLLRPSCTNLPLKAEIMHWLEKVKVLDAAARTLGLRFETGADRLLGPYWENTTGVPLGRLVAEAKFEPPCELLGSLVSKITKGVLDAAATDRREFELDVPDLTRASRVHATLFLTGARPDVAVVLKLSPAVPRLLKLQFLYPGRDQPAGEVAVTHGIEPAFLRAGRYRVELSLSTVVGFAAFHATVHRVQLRAE